MTEWTRQRHPVKEGALKEGSAGYTIMKRAKEAWAAEEAADLQAKTDAEATSSDANANGDTTANGDAKAKKDKVVFDEVLGKDKAPRRGVRYQQNPRENWGPMTKHKGNA